MFHQWDMAVLHGHIQKRKLPSLQIHISGSILLVTTIATQGCDLEVPDILQIEEGMQ